MRIADFFKSEIRTFCNVQGVRTEVLVRAEYVPALTGGPACSACGKPCNVIESKSGMYSEHGHPLGRPVISGVSACCKVGYSVSAAGAMPEMVEALAVKNTRGVSIMDSLYMVEIEELEDRLLETAKADLFARREAARAFALEQRLQAVREGEMQRGFR